MTTTGTDKRQITGDFPDFGGASIDFELASTVAINTGNAEIFPQKRYTMTLDANGNDDGAFYLPTPDADNSSAWGWFIELPDGERVFVAISYGDGTALSLAEILAAVATSTTPSDLTGLYVLKAGDTMTGQLNFTGTDHAGIKLLPLTTAQRTALTAAVGMLPFDSTLNQLFWYNGSAWVTPLLLSGGTMTGELIDLEDRALSYTTSTAGPTYTIDITNGRYQEITITGDVQFLIQTNNAARGHSLIVRIIQDNTGGHTVTFADSFATSGGLTPSIETGANVYHYLTCVYNAVDGWWDTFDGGGNFSQL